MVAVRKHTLIYIYINYKFKFSSFIKPIPPRLLVLSVYSILVNEKIIIYKFLDKMIEFDFYPYMINWKDFQCILQSHSKANNS